MSRLWWVYTAVGCLIIGGYPLLPAAYQRTAYDAISASVIVAVLVGMRRHRPALRLPWYLFAVGQACYTVADASWNVVQDRYGSVPSPSWIDVLYLAYYPLVAVGLLLLVRSRGGGRRSGVLIDALVVASVMGMVTWLLVRPAMVDPSLSMLGALVNLAYPVGDLALLVLVLRLVLDGGRRCGALRLLVVSFVLTTVADLLFLVLSARFAYPGSSGNDALWLAGYVAFGAAALHPSMARMGDGASAGPPRFSRARVALLGAAMLVAPIALGVSATGGHSRDLATFTVGAGVLYLLVLSRIVGVVRQHERSLRQEQTVRGVGLALTAANSAPEVYRLVRAAAAELIGQRHEVGPRAAAADPVRFTLGAPGDPARLSVTGPDPLDAEISGSLAALNTALTLACERVAWSEQSQRSERRFRSIVDASSDIVFLLGPDSRISWCAPSILRILGYLAEDTIGRQPREFVHPDDVATSEYLRQALVEPGSTAHVDCRLRMRDGTYRIFQVTGRNMRDDPDVDGVVLTGLDVTERRQLSDELHRRAFLDDLSGLANRALFTDRLQHALCRRTGSGREVAILFIDLDDFKTVNDSLGHQAGDSLLVQVARRLPGALRSADTAARLGGDEFAVLLEDTDEAGAVQIAERVLAELAAPFRVERREVFVAASIGVTTSRYVIDDPDLLLRNADIAMYQAKAAGKNRHAVYRPSMHAAAVQRLELQADLQRAVERDEFEVYYQPVLDLRTNRLVSVEALVRWQHPERGLVSPAEFIPLAEESGLIEPLGRWVLRQACQQLRAWHRAHPARFSVAVNVSFRQLAVPGFLDDVIGVLNETGIDPGYLVLELTESAFMADVEAAEGKLSTLRELGVRIAIDDFGTGYSSLSYLDRYPIDLIKIDQSFVATLPTADDDSTLVRIMLDLADRLNLPVVAEGIENAEQLATLRRLGCALGQGFLLADPRPPAGIEAMLRSGARDAVPVRHAA